MSDKKVVHIPAELHRQLRIRAAKGNTNIRSLVTEAIAAFLKTPLVVEILSREVQAK